VSSTLPLLLTPFLPTYANTPHLYPREFGDLSHRVRKGDHCLQNPAPHTKEDKTKKRWVARTCLAMLVIAIALVIAMALVPPTTVDLVISTLRGASALPDPTGTWSGTWLSYITLKGGIANFELVYDPLTLTVSGTAGFLLNKLIPVPINVAGLNTVTGFTLMAAILTQ
jgi:hypothetical protein